MIIIYFSFKVKDILNLISVCLDFIFSYIGFFVRLFVLTKLRFAMVSYKVYLNLRLSRKTQFLWSLWPESYTHLSKISKSLEKQF